MRTLSLTTEARKACTGRTPQRSEGGPKAGAPTTRIIPPYPSSDTKKLSVIVASFHSPEPCMLLGISIPPAG